MSTPQQDFHKFLDEQRADYQRALPEKTANIHALWGAVRLDAEAAAALTDLERLAHMLAGTAGTLGFRALGLAAQALQLEQAAQTGLALTPAAALRHRAGHRRAAGQPAD